MRKCIGANHDTFLANQKSSDMRLKLLELSWLGQISVHERHLHIHQDQAEGIRFGLFAGFDPFLAQSNSTSFPSSTASIRRIFSKSPSKTLSFACYAMI